MKGSVTMNHVHIISASVSYVYREPVGGFRAQSGAGRESGRGIRDKGRDRKCDFAGNSSTTGEIYRNKGVCTTKVRRNGIPSYFTLQSTTGRQYPYFAWKRAS